MDPGFYEDLAGRLYGLLIGLEDRLNCDDVSVIHEFAGDRHYALALEEIAQALAACPAAAITDAERAGMLALADKVDALARADRTRSPGEPVREVTRSLPALRTPEPGPDGACYEDLAGRLYGLAIRLRQVSCLHRCVERPASTAPPWKTPPRCSRTGRSPSPIRSGPTCSPWQSG